MQWLRKYVIIAKSFNKENRSNKRNGVIFIMEHLVVIGGVAAGTKAAAKARRENPDLKITIFTDEDKISYSACGLPYFIKGVIPSYDKLIARTPEEFQEKENINVVTEHRVIEISPNKKRVLVQNLITGDIIKQEYTKLLIATGASPIVPPIDGIGAKNVFTLRSINDGIAIKEKLKDVKKALIIGGGYIGIELLEALLHNDIDTKVIEKSPQLMPSLDEDIAISLLKEVQKNYPDSIVLNDGVKKFLSEDGKLTGVETESGKRFEADIAILSVGVKPNVELAKAAGIETGSTGAIKVDKYMQTNIENIFAAGDCAEKNQMQVNEPIWIPLGSTANKEGRVAGSNIFEIHDDFKGILGSAVTRFFDLNISMTGITEKQAKKYGIDYVSTILTSNDKAGYMPDVKDITIKMLANKKNGKLLGIQAIGHGNIDKNVNIVAAGLSSGMTVKDYADIDISYAPPFSKAIDITTVAAYVLQNKIDKKAKSISIKELQECDCTEYQLLMVDNEEFKDPTNEMKDIVVVSFDAMQSYIVAKKLEQKGYDNVRFLEGGCSCLEECIENLLKEQKVKTKEK